MSTISRILVTVFLKSAINNSLARELICQSKNRKKVRVWLPFLLPPLPLHRGGREGNGQKVSPCSNGATAVFHPDVTGAGAAGGYLS